jgi:hypothetical protein
MHIILIILMEMLQARYFDVYNGFAVIGGITLMVYCFVAIVMLQCQGNTKRYVTCSISMSCFCFEMVNHYFFEVKYCTTYIFYQYVRVYQLIHLFCPIIHNSHFHPCFPLNLPGPFGQWSMFCNWDVPSCGYSSLTTR